MTDQKDLFDKRVPHHLPPSVTEDLQRAVAYFTQQRLPFSAESLRERLTSSSRAVLEQEEHINALGGFVQQLARKRAIRPKGWVVSHRGSARGRPLRMWEAA